MFDLAFDRERRREKQGYVTPAQARAFLQMSRQLRLGHDAMPPANPIARAYFRAIDETTTADDTQRSRPFAGGIRRAGCSGGLRRGGRRGRRCAPRGRVSSRSSLERCSADRRVTRRVSRASRRTCSSSLDRDPAAYSRRNEELAYLANTLMAGCSIQARPFTAQEASDAAVAVCNLGLENWPSHWLPAKARRGSSVIEAGTALPDDFLVGHDLVSVFQVGWTVLHDDVCMYAAEQLIEALTRLRCDDREIQTGLDALRIEHDKTLADGSAVARSGRAGCDCDPGHAGVGRAARTD